MATRCLLSQGTKNMVQRARTGGRGIGGVAGAAAMAGGDRPTVKGHSSRKNKPQRCSVCGGIGHKSRTCSMAVTPNTQAMCQPVQWAATQPGMVQAGTDPTTGQMTYVPVQGGWQPAPGQVAGQGGMVMTAQGAMMQTVNPASPRC